MKISDIRPDELIKKQAKILSEDIASIIKHKNDFVIVRCPACGSASNKPIFEKYGFRFVECNKCSTIFTNPRPTPKLLKEYYRTSKNYTYWSKYIFPASEDTRRKKIFAPRAKRIGKICSDNNHGSIMDIGAAFGTFCQEVKKIGKFKKITALEPTPELAKICRSKGFEVIEQPFEEVSLQQKFDVLTAFEVIEHIFKPLEFVKKANSILKDNGFMMVTCPNAQGFEIAYLRERSDSVDNEHLNLFNPSSLQRLFRRGGFEIIEVSTPGKLDVELVQNKEKLQGVMKLLTDKPLFQQFLSDNLLSSHMWMVARKKKNGRS